MTQHRQRYTGNAAPTQKNSRLESIVSAGGTAAGIGMKTGLCAGILAAKGTYKAAKITSHAAYDFYRWSTATRKRSVYTLVACALFLGVFSGNAALGHSSQPQAQADTAAATSASVAMPGFSTGALAGMNFGDGLFYITGLRGAVPEYANVDFKQHLREVWADKIAKQGEINPLMGQMHDDNVAFYYDSSFTPAKMSIDEYISRADFVIEDARNSLDWNVVGASFGLDQRRSVMLRQITDKIDGKGMVAYSLTELMPTADGDFNIALFDYLAQNAGVEYLNLFPSLFDSLFSFGPYQFTKFAVGDPNIDGDSGGASIVNRALPPEKKIPSQVYGLRGDDHVRAAFLFSIYNSASLLRILDDKQAAVFANVGKGDLTEYIATAHNNPRSAVQSAQRFIDNGMMQPFRISASPDILGYAIKTGANFEALQRK